MFAGIGLDHRDDQVKVEWNLCGLDEFAGDLESRIRITLSSLLLGGVGTLVWITVSGNSPHRAR